MKLIKLGAAIITILLISNVVLANTAVDDSITVKNLSAEIEHLQTNNTLLKQQIAQSGSLTNLTSRVEAMGFVTSPTVVSIAKSSVASR